MAMPLDCAKMKRLREKLGLTMDQAAEKAGMGGKQQWYAIESGRRPDVQVSTLDAIAKALGVKPAALLK